MDPGTADSKTALVTHDDTSTRRTYRTRWYVLCLVSIMSCVQNCIWAGWGPIAQSAKVVYGWDDRIIDMLVNAGNIACIVFILPAAWLLDVKGLRVSIVLASVVIAVGSGLRCITSQPIPATWLIFLGQILNGIGGTMAFAAPPLLSGTWFPPQERTTATGIGILFSSAGGALSFLLGPLIVSEPTSSTGNYTIGNSSWNNSSTPALACNISDKDISLMRGQIKVLNYLEFGLAAGIAVLVLVYFPNKPPTPPSVSAGAKRMGFKDGLKLISKMFAFWHLALAFSIPSGVYGVWSSTLDVSIHQFGISQTEAGWLGFWGNTGGTLLGILISRFADIFAKRMKLFLICIYSLSTIFYVLFTLMVIQLIPGNSALIYFTCISGGVFVTGAMPLFYEMACEGAYPAAEGVISGCITLFLNLTGSFVLLLSLIPNIGTAWMNWAMVSSVAAAVLLMATFDEQYRRSKADATINISQQTNSSK
ncbi:disrupted in renal carcinoma protein 2 homolog [Mizuhopecten yessoensis]|uniref:Disrupted in renal carcinoma protein 2-like n=1 Tax=Mizuhopecten yessoensis TaxID=6573 RepID=A0A210PW23_MIZYE|nr:disrupted in renal carcinoma protein 2 homolog [Mizuhopecten yessoensis]OWF40666.1 Disrupted in renal carcinoma protein 2-like [Mizuhopecten yessoensis]